MDEQEREALCPTCLWCSPQSSLAHPRRDLTGKITYLDVPFGYVYRSALPRERWRLAISKLEILFETRKQMGQA